MKVQARGNWSGRFQKPSRTVLNGNLIRGSTSSRDINELNTYSSNIPRIQIWILIESIVLDKRNE